MVVLQYINTILVVLQWNGDNAIILVLQYHSCNALLVLLHCNTTRQCWWYCSPSGGRCLIKHVPRVSIASYRVSSQGHLSPCHHHHHHHLIFIVVIIIIIIIAIIAIIVDIIITIIITIMSGRLSTPRGDPPEDLHQSQLPAKRTHGLLGIFCNLVESC